MLRKRSHSKHHNFQGTPNAMGEETHHGREVVVSCLISRIHPSALMRAKYPNAEPQMRLSNAVVGRKQVKTISWRDQMEIIFIHDDFKEDEMMMELYAVECFVKVEQEGPNFFFEAVGVGDDANTVGDPTAQEILSDDHDEVHGAGVEVDDDNLPTPENIPTPNEEVQSVTGDWGINRQCYRRAAGHQNLTPQLENCNMGSSLTLFKQLFPIMFLKDVIIANINKVIKGEQVEYREMLHFFGLWFLMWMQLGPQCCEYFSSAPVNEFEGVPILLNQYMSHNWFEAILYAVSFMKDEAPLYVDKFLCVQRLIDAWNENMNEKFQPGWITCLDESMLTWTNKLTCPGFMFVP